MQQQCMSTDILDPNTMSVSCIQPDLCYEKMVVDRHLEFFTGSENWCYRKLRLSLIYLHNKFDEHISKDDRVMAIYMFSKWRTAAILYFVRSNKLTSPEVAGDWHIEFGKDISSYTHLFVKKGRPTAILNFYRKWKLIFPKDATNPYLYPLQTRWRYLKWRLICYIGRFSVHRLWPWTFTLISQHLIVIGA